MLVIAAGAEQETNSGSVSGDKDQRLCHLLSTVWCNIVQSQLVVHLSIHWPWYPACPSCSHHSHCSAEKSDQCGQTTATHQSSERVIYTSCVRWVKVTVCLHAAFVFAGFWRWIRQGNCSCCLSQTLKPTACRWLDCESHCSSFSPKWNNHNINPLNHVIVSSFTQRHRAVVFNQQTFWLH